MSFNLIYNDKGIDFSGFAEGISTGLKMRFEQEKYERKLFDEEMKQFQLTWKPDKLKPSDKQDYMAAMEEYKNSRKNELRLDKKWSVKAEERQAAYERAERAKAVVGEIYSQSQAANQYLANSQKTINIYTTQKINPPPEALQMIQKVRDTKSTDLDFSTIPDISTFDVMPSTDDMLKYTNSLSSDKLYTQPYIIPDETKPFEEIPKSVPYLNGKKIYYKKEFRYMTPQQALSTAQQIEGTRLENKATMNYNSFANALQSNPTSQLRIEADKKAKAISEAAGINVADINKFHLWAYDNRLFEKKYVKTIEDRSEVELALKGLAAKNDAESLRIRNMLANNQIAVGNSQIGVNNMYKFLGYIKSPEAEGAFNSSEPNSMFRSMFGDYKLDADKYFKAIRNLKKKGAQESVSDLYNKLNSGQLSLDDLSKEDD